MAISGYKGCSRESSSSVTLRVVAAVNIGSDLGIDKPI